MIVLNEAKPNWKTIKGTHVRINKKGQIVDGPDSLKDLNPADKDTKNNSSESSSQSKSNYDDSDDNHPFADAIANGIMSAEQWIENNVVSNLGHR